MRQVPWFTKTIRTHKIHPVHMTLRFLCSVAFKNLIK
eukprot:Gb_18842 [translate_table: standard]